MLSSQVTNKQSLADLVKENKDALFALSNEEFIKVIQKVIPESSYLKGKADATVEARQEEKSAKKVYNLTEVEEIRAFAGLWLFKEVVNGTKEDYESFVKCQRGGRKPVLSYESFLALNQYINDTLKTPEDFAAAMWSILCNDLGKTEFLQKEYEKTHPKGMGHDKLLAELLRSQPDLFAGFMELTPEHREHIIAGYASGCDISMYEQLELPSVSLAALKALNPRTLALYDHHTRFDVAGAAAQTNHEGSLTMHQETHNFFVETRKSLDSLHGPEACSIEGAYNNYLNYRGKCINIENNSEENRALIRIAGLSRLGTPEQGDMLKLVWKQLPDATKSILVKELNVSGSHGESAIFIGYGVAMLMNSQGAMQDELTRTTKDKGITASPAQRAAATREGLSIGLITMAKLFAKTRELLGSSNPHKVLVADGTQIANTIKSLQEAKANPRDILTMDLLAKRKSDNRRVKFKLEKRLVEYKDHQETNASILPEGTKLSTNPNAKFTPASTSIVKDESNNLIVTQSARL